MTGTTIAAQPSALSEAAGLLLFFGVVGLITLLGVFVGKYLKYLRGPLWVLEVCDVDDGDGWWQPHKATRDLGHARWAASQWRASGYATRLINLNDFDQEV